MPMNILDNWSITARMYECRQLAGRLLPLAYLLLCHLLSRYTIAHIKTENISFSFIHIHLMSHDRTHSIQ